MILIDALYINNSGGKVLLDYLILRLDNTTIDTHFLLDERIIGNHPKIKSDKVTYLKGSFFKRHLFYLKNRHQFSKILCFGNLPPNLRLNAEVFTYFHQMIYLDVPKEFSFLERLKFKLKILVLRYIKTNTNYWLVQSNLIKEKLGKKLNIAFEKIAILPFYPQFERLDQLKVIRIETTYLYVSNAMPHKNHKRLINTFCQFYDQYQKGKLILTVNEDYSEVLELIDNKQRHGYPIENVGFVERIALQKIYQAAEFLIFPSVTESFGLGLIEAIECGCKVIGADLPYTYEICNPTLVFDPLNEHSLFNAFEKSLNTVKLQPTVPIIQNNIKQIIDLLK